MPSNKFEEKIPICKLCFRPVQESMHYILDKKSYLCKHCFNRFNPKLEQFDIEGVRGFYIFPYDQTVQELLYQFKGCFDAIKSNPVFGLGYGWTGWYRSTIGRHPTMLSFESCLKSSKQ